MADTITPIPDTLQAPKSYEEQQAEETNLPIKMTFEHWKGKLTALEGDWVGEKNETERRRNIRKIEIDNDLLRSSGRLKADETLIGVRVIDENIKKEQPIFVNYLTQSRRLAIFDCQSNPLLTGIENLETAFTKGMSYDGMLRSLFKEIDGAQTHGWDSVEITYDPTKPLKVGFEHIGHEHLLFPIDAKDIQACAYIMRRFKLTVEQLKKFVKKYDFDEKQVDVAIEGEKSRTNITPKNVDIYKVFFKLDEVVYVAWTALDKNVSDWIKAPAPLKLNRKETKERTVMVQKNIPIIINGMESSIPTQVPQVEPYTEELVENQYPIKIYLYSETEEQNITGQKGRVFFDLPWQEAQIALRSSFINGAMRAANVYGSPANRSDVGGVPTKLDMTLESGCFYSEPMNFWGTQYPDPAILRAADALDVRKAAEMGQMASAVINREDSRKTATELNKAESEQSKLNSVSILLFSGHMRGLLAFAWYLIQNYAQYNEVILVPKEGEGGKIVNDPVLINQTYDIKPAGDIDVIRRAERLEKRFQLLPVLQPMGGEMYFEFVADLIREMLPQDAQKYISLMQRDQMKTQALIAMAGMLKEAVTDESGQLKPEFKEFAPQMQQLAQMGQQLGIQA